jgi:FixJ family two-component response regulator
VQHAQPVIAIVDNDPAICRALSRLLQTVGWRTVAFSSAEAFLQAI